MTSFARLLDFKCCWRNRESACVCVCVQLPLIRRSEPCMLISFHSAYWMKPTFSYTRTQSSLPAWVKQIWLAFSGVGACQQVFGFEDFSIFSCFCVFYWFTQIAFGLVAVAVEGFRYSNGPWLSASSSFVFRLIERTVVSGPSKKKMMAKMKYSEIPRDLSSDSIAAYRLAQVNKWFDYNLTLEYVIGRMDFGW